MVEAQDALVPVDPRITKDCWQYKATRNVAAAAVLHDLKAEHIPSGRCAVLPCQCSVRVHEWRTRRGTSTYMHTHIHTDEHAQTQAYTYTHKHTTHTRT